MGIARLKQVRRWMVIVRTWLECDPCSYSMKNVFSHRTGCRGGFPFRSSNASPLWLHFCLFHFCPRCHCGRQDLRGLSGPFFHKDYLSSPLLTALPHTMCNLRHLLTIVLSAFQGMSYFHQSRAGKLFQKMASRKGLDHVVWLG